jgi:uncharacterized membrane protein (UPF0136 family)
MIMLVSGLTGYVKAKSRASLVAGMLSAAALLVFFGVTFHNLVAGLVLGAIVAGEWCLRYSPSST